MQHWEELKVNEKGHLVIDGMDACDLAAKYKTPLYVMEEKKIRQVCRGFKQTFADMDAEGDVLFAAKAFLTTAMCKIIQSEGLGMDLVSEGEAYTAFHAGFPMERTYFHGNNKTPEGLRMVMEWGVGTIVVDGLPEIDMIDRYAKELNKRQRVIVRVKPGVEAHTHDYIKTGVTDCKFGFGVFDNTAMEAAEQLLSAANIDLVGLHCHIGSQIFELEPFEDTVGIMTDFVLALERKFGCKLNEINFGGGFGIHYVAGDKPLAPEEYVKVIIRAMQAQCEQKGIGKMRVVIEPGRSVVGEAGTTLYTIGTIKDIPDVRKYVSVDGGMTDNPRPALYQAKYTAVVANKANVPATDRVSVAGRCCESGDMLIWDALLAPAEPGDILAIFSTGAYNYSMASNYNKIPHAAVVLVNGDRSDLMVERQTLSQLAQNDRVPEWLL